MRTARLMLLGLFLVAGCASSKIWVNPNIATDEAAMRDLKACELYADGAGGTYYGGDSILANVVVGSWDRKRIVMHCMEAAGYHLEDKQTYYEQRASQPVQSAPAANPSPSRREECEELAGYSDDELYVEIEKQLIAQGTPVIPAEIYKGVGAMRMLCAQQLLTTEPNYTRSEDAAASIDGLKTLVQPPK